MSNRKHLFLIHGRSFKPGESSLKELWIKALRYGIERDFDKDAGKRFDDLKKTFVYFGDLSNEFLGKRGQKYCSEADYDAREAILSNLMEIEQKDFLDKKFYYERSSSFRSFKKFVIGALAAPAEFFGVAHKAASKIAPDMAHYWYEDTEFGSEVRAKLTTPLRKALEAGEDVMLIGHSLGTLVAYDVLWKFSYMSEHLDIRGKNLSYFVSLGSPLGNPTVQKRLKGGRIKKAERRYPTNICQWSNVAAADDYICHDETLTDDFRRMEGVKKDRQVYNLAVKNGAAHQHHGTGYLIHPTVAGLVNGWVGTNTTACRDANGQSDS